MRPVRRQLFNVIVVTTAPKIEEVRMCVESGDVLNLPIVTHNSRYVTGKSADYIRTRTTPGVMQLDQITSPEVDSYRAGFTFEGLWINRVLAVRPSIRVDPLFRVIVSKQFSPMTREPYRVNLIRLS